MTPEAHKKQAETQRGRGEGKSYAKLNGRHMHRIVAEEQVVMRPLTIGEIVHHKDGNRQNNAAENLEVLPNQAEHSRIHAKDIKHPCKAFCKHGHPLSGGNLKRPKNGRRVCLTCRRIYDAAYQRAKRKRLAAAREINRKRTLTIGE